MNVLIIDSNLYANLDQVATIEIMNFVEWQPFVDAEANYALSNGDQHTLFPLHVHDSPELNKGGGRAGKHWQWSVHFEEKSF